MNQKKTMEIESVKGIYTTCCVSSGLESIGYIDI